MLSDEFTTALQEALKASIARDIFVAMKAKVLEGDDRPEVAHYFDQMTPGQNPESEWSAAGDTLRRELIYVARSDRAEAMRLTQVAARYAVGKSSHVVKEMGLDGHHFAVEENGNIERPIYSCLFGEMRNFAEMLATHRGANSIGLDEGGVMFGFAKSAINPPDDVWRQYLRSLFYFARRAINRHDYSDPVSQVWEEVADSSFSNTKIAPEELALAQLLVSKTPERTRNINKLVEAQAAKHAVLY
jgi:hypothetical protein